MLSVTPQDSAGRQELFVVSFFSRSDASSRERFFGNVSSFWLFSWSKCGFEGLGPLKRLEKAR